MRLPEEVERLVWIFENTNNKEARYCAYAHIVPTPSSLFSPNCVPTREKIRSFQNRHTVGEQLVYQKKCYKLKPVK